MFGVVASLHGPSCAQPSVHDALEGTYVMLPNEGFREPALTCADSPLDTFAVDHLGLERSSVRKGFVVISIFSAESYNLLQKLFTSSARTKSPKCNVHVAHLHTSASLGVGGSPSDSVLSVAARYAR